MSEFTDKINAIDKLLLNKLTEDEKTALMDIEIATDMGSLCTSAVFRLDLVKFEKHITDLLSDKVKKAMEKDYENYLSGDGYEEPVLKGIINE